MGIVVAGGVAGISPISAADLPMNAPIFSPSSRNALHIDQDKPAGIWNWDSVEKLDMPDGFPTSKARWNVESEAEKRDRLQSLCTAWEKADPVTLKACPAAVDFPGIPGNGNEVRLVSRAVTIDPTIGGWHSTGLYAPPGVRVSVTFPDRVKLTTAKGKQSRYSVRIGCHKDRLSKRHKQWSRLPRITIEKPVRSTTCEITNPMGGLIYVCVNGLQKGEKPFTVQISHGTPSPIYIMGRTSLQEWKNQLKETASPWGEIQTPRLTVTLSREQLAQCPDVKSIAECLQKNMALEDWLIAWDQQPDRLRTPMRIVVDRQISAGAGHSGYPAMGHMSWGKPIATGTLLTRGSWGFWHELGHNHQTPPFRLDGMGEVTVNLFSMICQVEGIGLAYEDSWGGLRGKGLKKQLKEFFTGAESFLDSNSHSLRLTFFVDIMKGLGFKPFRAAAIAYHKNPYDPKKTSNAEKWDWLMVELSRGAGKNLSRYFEVWKVPVSKSAQDKVANLPVWLPSSDYPACYAQ